jgi:hypothetical protein
MNIPSVGPNLANKNAAKVSVRIASRLVATLSTQISHRD